MITGRPRKELDYPTLEKLCSICATQEEIAHWFDMTVDTLNARCRENYGETFLGVYKKFADEGKMSLRRKQMQIAMDGNVTMCIWLGKNMLGQVDTPLIDQSSHHTFQIVNYGKEVSVNNKNTNRLIPTT